MFPHINYLQLNNRIKAHNRLNQIIHLLLLLSYYYYHLLSNNTLIRLMEYYLFYYLIIKYLCIYKFTEKNLLNIYH